MEIRMEQPTYPAVFAGIGFHNSEAGMYRLMSERFFHEKIAKCYREISPGFMRCFGGFSDWSREAMDDFCEYYQKMQAVTDTPIYMVPGRGKIHFSDAEIEDYCNQVAEKLAYLIREKKVRHLAYYCFSNELAQVTMGHLISRLPLFGQYQEQLYRAFQNHGLNIGLLATDAANDWSSLDWAMQNLDIYTKDYCGHYYEHDHTPKDASFYQDWYERCKMYADKASRKDKHFILGEYGITNANLKICGASASDACSFFENPQQNTELLGVMQAEMVIGAVNAGVFAMGFWTYCDYPDPVNGPSDCDEYMKMWSRYEPYLGGGINHRYNRWGLIPFENHFDEIPRPVYWCLAPIMKYLKRNSQILSVQGDSESVHACAVRTRENRISTVVSSRLDHECDITLRFPESGKNSYRVYRYLESAPPINRFGDLQAPSETLSAENGVVTLSMPANSVAVVTNDYEEKAHSVCAEGLALQENTLTWNPVSDDNHCYYRVYEVENNREKQIASTIACSCRVENPDREYRVYSVDIYGNR